MDEHYQDRPIPDDPETPGARLVATLAEWDETHTGKAAILAKLAQMEFTFAHEDGEDAIEDEPHFVAFAEKACQLVDDAVEETRDE